MIGVGIIARRSRNAIRNHEVLNSALVLPDGMDWNGTSGFGIMRHLS